MQNDQNPFGETNPYQVSAAELTSREFPTELAAQAKRGNSGFAVVGIAMFVLSVIFAISMLSTLVGVAAVLLPDQGAGGDSFVRAFGWLLLIPTWIAILAVPVGQLICYRIPASVISKRLLLFCYPGYIVPVVFVLLTRALAEASVRTGTVITVLMIVAIIIAYAWPYVSQLLFLSHVRQVALRVGAERAASTAFIARIGLLCLPVVLFGLGVFGAFMFGGGPSISVIFTFLAFGVSILGGGSIFAYGLSCWQLFRFVSSSEDPAEETYGSLGGMSDAV